MTRTDLHGWTLELTGVGVPQALGDARLGPMPASVPGTVHTDLLALDLIADPYLDVNEASVWWIGETDAVYRTRFDRGGPVGAGAGHERVDLVAEGLDTVATVSLNGTEIARTRNQHRSYRIPVVGLLTDTDNDLEVAFDAPLRAARESERRIGAKPLVGAALPYNAVRKMASNFGWDWGPTLTTAGIWRPIWLHGWSTARLAHVVPQVSVDADGTGTVQVRVDVERTGSADLSVQVRVTGPDGTVVARADAELPGTQSSAALRVEVAHPQLWWPRGYGDQPLYRTTVTVSHAGGELDSWSRGLGFRTAEVVMTPDEFGTPFQFRINGQDIWVKGANWITDDVFPHRVTAQDYARGVADAVGSGMNMLRVWGGGIYESDVFYDLCDRAGILLWQDFAFACAMYSEHCEMWDEVEAEAREQVARLASHPSLVLWNGSNENIEAYHGWGFKERMAPAEAWGRGYYEELLPRVLAEVDPSRAYIPSSPWNPVDDADPRDPDHGPVHSWKVWFSRDYLAYRDAIPRFVAEFGFQGPAAFATLSDAVHDATPRPDSPGMAAHQKSIDGNAKLERGWAGHLPVPTTFDRWHVTTQLDQVRAITCAVSHFRSHAPRTSGYLVWQLNDCWPAISWSAVDSAGRRKPLWYTLRELNAPRLLMLQPRGSQPALVVSNDTAEVWVTTVRVQRLTVSGVEIAATDVAIELAPRSNRTVLLDAGVAVAGDPRQEVLVATDLAVSGGPGVERAWWYFVEDVELGLNAPRLRTQVRRTDRGHEVTLTAEVLLKDVMVFPDRLDPSAVVDQMLVTLLPGESRTLTVASTADLDPRDLTTPPVLWSVNHLLHPSEPDHRDIERPRR
ncbi:MAG: glycoside hydrolase family 2 protein [Cellulomonas sp.]